MYLFWAAFWKMAIKRSAECLCLGTFFGHSRYKTKFKNAKICSTLNHKCPGLKFCLRSEKWTWMRTIIMYSKMYTLPDYCTIGLYFKQNICHSTYCIDSVLDNDIPQVYDIWDHSSENFTIPRQRPPPFLKAIQIWGWFDWQRLEKDILLVNHTDGSWQNNAA